jgi:hypothetical protein
MVRFVWFAVRTLLRISWACAAATDKVLKQGRAVARIFGRILSPFIKYVSCVSYINPFLQRQMLSGDVRMSTALVATESPPTHTTRDFQSGWKVQDGNRLQMVPCMYPEAMFQEYFAGQFAINGLSRCGAIRCMAPGSKRTLSIILGFSKTWANPRPSAQYSCKSSPW